MRATAVFFIFATICVISVFSDDLIEIGGPKKECTEPHQRWTSCASVCEPQCKNFRGKKCPKAITLQCILNKCVCEQGSARIEEDKCLPLDSEECGGLYDAWKDPDAN